MNETTTFANRFTWFAKWLFSVVGIWLLWSGVASAAQITSFASNVVVQADSSLLVTDTITYDFGTQRKHGIFRNISEKHAQDASTWYKERYIELTPISVKRDGNNEPYILEEYAGLSLRVGRSDETITGLHTYVIKYQVEGALSVFGDEVELYWNVTGDEWPVAINQVKAQLGGVPSVLFGNNANCYVGVSGSVKKCDATQSASQLSVFSQRLLLPGQQLTVARSLSLSQPPVVLERMNSLLLWLVLLVVGLVTLVVSVYRWRTKYKTSRPVIAQYSPYEDFKPMFTGVLFDNRLDTKDISAGIVYLAQQGFISIKEIKSKVLFLFDYTDYEVTLLRPITESETYFHEQLLHLLFGVSGVSGEVIKLSAIKKDRSKLMRNSKIIKKLRKAVVKDLVEKGFVEQRISRAVVAVMFFLMFFFGFGALSMFIEQPLFSFPVFIAGVIFVYFLFTSERRTERGYETENHLQGFKLYLKVTEKERYKFHNAPSLSPQQFMEYLPYAIAFGVEKEWAKVFEDIQIGAPDWYTASAGSSFNVSTFTTNLSSFSTSFSGSTGSSGSSGGGSAGGGSGGGGGGSW